MIKAFISDPRCLTLDIQPKLEVVSRETRLSADIFILYQDYLNIEKTYMDEALFNNIPVLVIQHGRQATRDYSIEGRDLRANKICLWGTIDYKRMRGLAYAKDRLVLTGSPLIENLPDRMRPDAFSPVKTVLFSPKYTPYLVEPNFAILQKLLNTPYKIIIKTIQGDQNIKVYEQCIQQQGDRASLVVTSPNGRPADHYFKMIDCLISANICVAVEESVNELMATAMDIPVVVVKNSWVTKDEIHFNGSHDIKQEGLVYSKDSYKKRLKYVDKKVESVLKVDDHQYQRCQVAVEEGGFGMPTSELIMNEIEKLVKGAHDVK